MSDIERKERDGGKENKTDEKTQNFKKFSESATLHGLQYIGSDANVVVK